jgi:CheY-like chemotaxis protein
MRNVRDRRAFSLRSVVIAVMLQKVDFMHGEALSSPKRRSRSILIVEDDVLLGMAIGLCVQDAGYEVAGLARSVEAALETLSHQTVDAALLDVNLQGELVFPVANALAERGVPFVFVTAHPPLDIPERHRHRPVVPKPYYDAAICAALESVLPLEP